MRNILLAALLALTGTARAQWQPGGVSPHNHTGPSDGGQLSNLNVLGYVAAGNLFLSLPIIPAGTILPLASSTVPTGFQECDGTSESTTTYSILYNVIGCSWGCADSSHFNRPDLRGGFMRGWNHGDSSGSFAGDPDSTARAALNTGGATGDNVGSYQISTFTAHTHTYGGITSGSAGQSGTVYSLNVPTQTGSAGGNETRPKNAYVMYIIKIDNSATGSTGTVVTSSFTISNAVNVNASLIGNGTLQNPLGVNFSSVTGGGGSFDGGTVANETDFLSSVTFQNGSYFSGGADMSTNFGATVLSLSANGRAAPSGTTAGLVSQDLAHQNYLPASWDALTILLNANCVGLPCNVGIGTHGGGPFDFNANDPSDTLDVAGSMAVLSTSTAENFVALSSGTFGAAPVQLYHCVGGASAGNMCYGNACSCSGGTWTAMALLSQ